MQFEIAALQAVVADMLGGETLHRTCKISIGMNQNGPESKKNGRHLRWLIIDEISQVSAELLGWYLAAHVLASYVPVQHRVWQVRD